MRIYSVKHKCIGSLLFMPMELRVTISEFNTKRHSTKGTPTKGETNYAQESDERPSDVDGASTPTRTQKLAVQIYTAL